jgi:hypothetical protein
MEVTEDDQTKSLKIKPFPAMRAAILLQGLI